MTKPPDPDAPDHPTPADGSATPPPVRRSRIHPNGYAMPGPYANTTGIILPKTQSAPAGEGKGGRRAQAGVDLVAFGQVDAGVDEVGAFA